LRIGLADGSLQTADGSRRKRNADKNPNKKEHSKKERRALARWLAVRRFRKNGQNPEQISVRSKKFAVGLGDGEGISPKSSMLPLHSTAF